MKVSACCGTAVVSWVSNGEITTKFRPISVSEISMVSSVSEQVGEQVNKYLIMTVENLPLDFYGPTAVVEATAQLNFNHCVIETSLFYKDVSKVVIAVNINDFGGGDLIILNHLIVSVAFNNKPEFID